MLDTIRHLRDIAQRCLDGLPLDSASARWLGTSLDNYLKHRSPTIEDALGLHMPRGGIPWWLEDAMRKRDAALRELARRHYPGLSVAAQAREINRLAVRYASTAWLRECNFDAPPRGDEGTASQWLWVAFKAGAAMPIGERQLRHVLGN